MIRMIIALMLFMVGCVQIDDGTLPVGPDVVPDVAPDEQQDGVDQQLLTKIIADTSLTKPVCMQYAAMYRAFAQTFKERTDIPAMMLLQACFKTSDQFMQTGSATVAEELAKLDGVDKSRDALSAEFTRLSVTFRAAAMKK